MHQPQQPSAAPDQPAPEALLEVTVPSDSDTSRRLTRVLALARWRSPSTVALLLAIPLIVMSRRFLELFTVSSRPGWKFTDLLLSYLAILALAAVIGLVLTAVQLVKRDPTVSAYTAPGTAISARFHQDSLELVLTTGVVAVAYHRIKDLFTIGDGVFLREKGTRGLALPGDLFPPAARDLIGAARGRAFAAGSAPAPQPSASVESPAVTGIAPRKTGAGNGDRKLAVIAVVGGIALLGAGAYAVGQDDSDTGSAAEPSPSHTTTAYVPIPDPCVLAPDQMQRFGFTSKVLNNDDLTLRRCDWDDDGNHPADRSTSGRLVLRTKRAKDAGPPRPVRVGDAVDGQEFVVISDPGTNHYVTCYIVWPTYYGFATSELLAYNFHGVDAGQLCRDTEELTNQLFGKLPR